MAAGVDGRGVLRRRVKLAAAAGPTVISSFSEIPVCGILIGHDYRGAPPAAAANTANDNAKAVPALPGLRRRGGPFLASCTMVTELSPLFDTAELTRLWAEYMLKNGVRGPGFTDLDLAARELLGRLSTSSPVFPWLLQRICKRRP